MPARPERFPLYDALRGLATLMVVYYHGLYQPAVFQGAGEWWWRYANHFDIAVPIFIGISGFLLYRPYIAARLQGRPRPSLKRYGLRRVLRIVPGFWFALTALALFYLAFPPGFEEVRSWEGVLRYYGFAQIYGEDTVTKAIGQAWTLNVEVVFYVALPLWILLAQRFSLRAELIGLAVLAAISIGWKAYVLSKVDPATYESLDEILPAPTWIDHFAVGMAVAALSVVLPEGPRRLWPFWLGAAVLWLAACWVVGPDGTTTDPVTDEIYLWRHVLYSGTVGCLLIVATYGARGLLALRPLAFVGTISFSLYLFHIAFYRQLGLWWGRYPDGVHEWLAWSTMLLAGWVALGAIGFYAIERPFMRLGSRRRRAQPNPASSSS